MSKPGVKTGVKDRTQGDIILRHKAIRDLWLCIQNDPELTVAEAATEFYYAVGELLEGKALAQLEFRTIDRKRALRHNKES